MLIGQMRVNDPHFTCIGYTVPGQGSALVPGLSNWIIDDPTSGFTVSTEMALVDVTLTASDSTKSEKSRLALEVS
jgi:hypothetical protein